MRTKISAIQRFLTEILGRKQRLPSQLASDIGVSHATVSRWRSGKDIPSVESCRKLAEYAGIPAERALEIAGYLPKTSDQPAGQWPEFREYARIKYANELDEDLVILIEDLIERRRHARNDRKDSRMGR